MVGAGFEATAEATELIAAHLRHSPLPDYVAQPLVTETALYERCAVVNIAPVIEGTMQGHWSVVFSHAGETCFTAPLASEGLAAMAALHYVLSHKSPVT